MERSVPYILARAVYFDATLSAEVGANLFGVDVRVNPFYGTVLVHRIEDPREEKGKK